MKKKTSSKGSAGAAPQKVAWIKRRGSIRIVIGGVMSGAVVLLVLISLFWTPYDPDISVLSDRLAKPAILGYESAHLLGADNLGRDVLSRIMTGGQISLAIGVMALIGTVLIGILFGLLSGFYGGLVDDILNMIAEIRNSMPMTLIIIVMLSIIGPSILSLAVLLALSEFVTIFRTTRAKTKLEKNMDYIVAARSNGASNRRIIFKYIMPNIINNVTVLATLMIGTIILEEAGLSYLGIGVARPYPSWGRMIADGQSYFSNGWWISTFPALTIAVFVLGINILGDGLRQMWKME